MATVKTGSVVSLIVGMVLLGACSSPLPARPREATPEAVDARPVLPVSVAASPAPPHEGTLEVVDSRPVLPGNVAAVPPPTYAPPTLAPPPALVPPAAPPSSAPSEIQPSTPATVASAVIGATGGTRVNVRASPSMGASILTTLAEGTSVEVLDEPISAEGRSWQKIRSGDREGWVVAVVVQPR
jgi:Bacterial SH3 domain